MQHIVPILSPKLLRSQMSNGFVNHQAGDGYGSEGGQASVSFIRTWSQMQLSALEYVNIIVSICRTSFCKIVEPTSSHPHGAILIVTPKGASVC